MNILVYEKTYLLVIQLEQRTKDYTPPPPRMLVRSFRILLELLTARLSFLGSEMV